jgi:predicted flap endonuclease-1-like 5' DNA nuclease
MDVIAANWVAFAIALLIGLLVAWWLFGRATTGASPRDRRPDVLDEGAAPAQRNQALIDSAPAATLVPTPASVTMAGIGEVIAVAAQDEVEAAVPHDAAPDHSGEPDDLTRIKGVGPKLAALLGSLGVTRYDQIAAWSDADLARIDDQLGAFRGRPTRDNWIEQCRHLATGDIAGFEARFGKV